MEPIPHLDRDGPIVPDGPSHLSKRPARVGEERQRILTEHHVERPGEERQACRVPLAPFDVGAETAGDRQHRRVAVEAHDGSAGPRPIGGETRDDTGAARDVENAISRPHARSGHQHPRP